MHFVLFAAHYCGLLAFLPIVLGNACPRTIVRDVVVIGGGASGAYAAVRLRDDLNKTVVLVEKEEILGGHVDSYTDTETGQSYNYGVQTFIETPNARAFFARHGIDVAPPTRLLNITTKYVDFTTGQDVPFVLPSSDASSVAMRKYKEVAEKYEHLMVPGYFNWPSPQDIPGDLLMPFRDFVDKYQIQDAVPTIWRITGVGSGDISDLLTMHVMQAFGAPMARALLLEQQQLVVASGRNQDLYDAVARNFGDDLLLSTTVTTGQRTDDGVVLLTENHKTGVVTRIKAKKLLVAMAPTEKNLKSLDLDDEERDPISKLTRNANWAGIVESSQLPVNGTLYNIPAAAAPSNYLELPKSPFTARFDYFGQGKYFRIMVITDAAMTSEETQGVVQQEFDNMVDKRVVSGNKEALKFVAWSHHDALSWGMSRQDILDGYYQKLYSIQGYRSTYWTGAAFATPFQTHLWEFDEQLLPMIVE
ncbi:hypothetical protein PspLS_09358 [Pyricularia sp. CBS 133598]|nr:hypothetical protein PspLS_09358 [Pyricularia sp. CBS 133598]